MENKNYELLETLESPCQKCGIDEERVDGVKQNVRCYCVLCREEIREYMRKLELLEKAEKILSGEELCEGYGVVHIRDPKNPCREYEPDDDTKPNDCDGDGHYLCHGCKRRSVFR